MPTYEYGCGACGEQWEELQRITEPATEVCPKCGKKSAHRLISAGTNFILKGGGWYSDLYSSPKSGSKTETKDSASSDSSSASKGSESKTSDAKTESKADTKPAASAPSTASTTPSSTSSSS